MTIEEYQAGVLSVAARQQRRDRVRAEDGAVCSICYAPAVTCDLHEVAELAFRCREHQENAQ